MKFRLRLLLAVFTVSTAISPLRAANAVTARFDSDYGHALLAGDAATILSRADGEIRLMPEFQRTIQGRDSAAAYYRAFAARFAVTVYQRTPLREFDLGSHLVVTGTFTQKLQRRSDGKEYELNGKYLDLWRKPAGAEPVLVTQAWNYDRWFDAGDDFRFADVRAFTAAQQPRVPADSNPRLELAAFCQLIGVAVTQHDGPVFARLFADDAVLLPNFDVVHAGRQAIDAWVATHFKELPVFEHLDIRNDRVDVLDGYLIEYASHVSSWKNGDSSGMNTGKNLRIWRREPDHALKLIAQIGAYD